MILRRPYAILIKYFRLIHVLLFGIFIYSLFAFRKIYFFLVDYVKKGTFNYIEDMAGKYVPMLLFGLMIIVLISAIFIYLLMKRKDKPSLFYVLMTVYSAIAIILMIFYHNFFASLSDTAHETFTIIVYRDIMAFLYYLCYFFVGILFVRAFGFDIKKFSFEKDKKELNLDSSDNEEVELGLSIDKYDAIKALRKEKREFSYYYKENKKIFNIIGIIIAVVIVIFVYIHFFVNNKVYSDSSIISVGSMDYKVLETFVTNHDSYQNVISNNSYFLVMNLEITNKGNSTYYLDKEMFRLNYNNNYLYLATNYCSSFADIGKCYTPDTGITKGRGEYILLFKIDKSSYDGYFEILKSKSNGFSYNKMKIETGEIKVSQEEYDMNNNYFNIISHEYSSNNSFQVQECVNDTCNTVTKTFKPDINNIILVLNVSNISDFTKEFLENYLGVYYYVNGKRYVVSSEKIDVLDVTNNNIYLSVPKIVTLGTDSGISFQTRRKSIYIKLGDRNE